MIAIDILRIALILGAVGLIVRRCRKREWLDLLITVPIAVLIMLFSVVLIPTCSNDDALNPVKDLVMRIGDAISTTSEALEEGRIGGCAG